MDLNGQRSLTLLSEGTMAEVMETIKPDMDYFFKEEGDPCLLDASPCTLGNQITQSFICSAVVPDSTQPLYIDEDIPSATCRLPAKEDYEGPFNFCVELDKSSSDKNKWIYSSSLNKIYVTMHSKVPVKLKLSNQERGLYVRALAIYLEEESFEDPVVRCFGHRLKEEKSNEGFSYVDHVIRCDAAGTTYEKDEESKRLSVLVPLELPQPGCEWSTIIYKFVCKNSCCMGMNRRATAVIFTLENKDGIVFGRKMFKLRICSCPKRDMGKEERDVLKEKEAESRHDVPVQEPIRGKKIVTVGKKMKRPHLQDIDLFQVGLPKLYIKSTAKFIQNSIRLMEQERHLTEGEKSALKDCEKYLK